MDNIIDVTFNFEAYEDVALNRVKKFNEAADQVADIKEIYEELKVKMQEDSVFAEISKLFGGKLVADIVDAIACLEVQAKLLKHSFEFLIKIMRARVNYIVDKYSQDEIYGNFKLRTEMQTLNKKIKKYENVLDSNLKIAAQYKLSDFGLEIEGEPGM